MIATLAGGAGVRVGAIDCGTNSIRLLIAEHGADGALVDVARRLEIVRLGQGVDASGEFHPDALARTFAAVDRYAALLAAASVPLDAVAFVATSAARDVRNREDFFAGVQQRLGVVPEVISGTREAELSFVGALSRSRPAREPVLVMDIGGGSTELIVGRSHATGHARGSGRIEQSVSLDVGSVRLTERFWTTNPPAAADLERASRYVDRVLVESALDLRTVGSWIGVAGTVTTLAAVHLRLEHDDRERVHGAVIPKAALTALLTRLSSSSVAEIRQLPGMHPQRADVITAGTLIATRVAAATPVGELLVSESDILDGIALDLLQRRGS